MGQSETRWVDRIRKRDGRIVPFDKRKIASAIYKASSAIGAPDSHLAEDLSEAVTIYLNHHFSGRMPSVEEIQDIVEKVLIRTGHDRMAKAYILYRHKRAELRRKTGRVALGEAEHLGWNGGGNGGSSHLDVHVQTSADDLTRWNRKRIVDVLVREVGLDPRFAEAISIEVEQEVMFKKLRHVTTSLIRELVDGKLLEYGLQEATRLHGRLGLPLYDVAATVSGTGPFTDAVLTPNLTSFQIAGSVKRQFASLKVLPRETVAAHTQGDFHIRGLWGIDRCDTLRVGLADMAKLVAQCHESKEGPTWEEIQLMARTMQAFVSKDFTLSLETEEDRSVLFSRNVLERGIDRDLAQSLAQADEDRPCLGIFIALKPGQEHREVVSLARGLLRRSASFKRNRSGWYPRGICLGSLREDVKDVLEETWPDVHEMVNSACPVNLGVFRQEDSKQERDSMCLFRVSLNLPRLAFLSHGQGNALMDGIERLMELSLMGYKTKKSFLRSTWGGATDRGYADFVRRFLLNRLEKACLQVGICGLDECVYSLNGAHIHETKDAMDMAVGIVSQVVNSCARLQSEQQQSIRMAADGSVRAPNRFSRLDLDRFAREATRVARIDVSTGGIGYTSGLRVASEHVQNTKERLSMEATLSSPLGRDGRIRLGRDDVSGTGDSLVEWLLKSYPHVDTVVLGPE